MQGGHQEEESRYLQLGSYNYIVSYFSLFVMMFLFIKPQHLYLYFHCCLLNSLLLEY